MSWALSSVVQEAGRTNEIQEFLSDNHTTVRGTRDWNKLP